MLEPYATSPWCREVDSLGLAHPALEAVVAAAFVRASSIHGDNPPLGVWGIGAHILPLVVYVLSDLASSVTLLGQSS